MSDWLFDLGNSRLKCAPLRADGRIGDVVAVDHDGAAFESGWVECLPPRFDAASVASVAPEAVRLALLDALTSRCVRISLACTQRRFGDVAIAYARPAQLGVDRFLAMVAARARGAQPWMVVGVGTALTVDLIDANGLHRGGRIAPSPALMRTALHQRARQLPEHGGAYVEFADDTPDALASGCDGAALALVERSLRHAEAMLRERPGLLLHGGGCALMIDELAEAIAAPSLVLDGLALVARDAAPRTASVDRSP